jgi:glutathione S-transferase
MIELYHNNLSVCAQKVRIVLAEKNVPWTSHYVNLVRGEQLTPEFKKMNPRGLVPVLVHDGNTIVESSVICSYLDEVFPNPPLSPKNPVERATMRLWCKLPDDILHMACATVSFAISFGQQLKKQAGAGLEERLMKMPDPARRERQRALIEKGIETPFFRDHIKVFEKTVAEMETQLGKTHGLPPICTLWQIPKSRPTSSVSIGSGLPVSGKAGRASRIGSRASRLARATRESRITHRLTTTTPDEMGSKIGHG